MNTLYEKVIMIFKGLHGILLIFSEIYVYVTLLNETFKNSDFKKRFPEYMLKQELAIFTCSICRLRLTNVPLFKV